MKSLNLRCQINSWTGYGRLSSDIIQSLLKYGINIKISPLSFDNKYPISPEILKLLTSDNLNDVFVISTPDFSDVSNKLNFGIYTMWETTRPKKHWLKTLNFSSFCSFPNNWNLNNFSAGGVVAPMHVVPLYVDDNFKLLDYKTKKHFTFGVAGNLESGGDRKGIEDTINIFLKTFPTENDVRLHVKTEKPLPFEIKDPRIKITDKFITDEELLLWYEDIDVFVNGSKTECWGFFVIQAMACGRPVISIKHAGIAEYFDENCGLVLPYEYEEAKFIWKYNGIFPKVKEEDAISSLRFAYENQELMKQKGLAAHEKTKQFTLQNTTEKLIELLTKYDFIKEKGPEPVLVIPQPQSPQPPTTFPSSPLPFHQISPYLEMFLSWYSFLENAPKFFDWGVQFLEISPRTNNNFDLAIQTKYILFVLEAEINLENIPKLRKLVENSVLTISSIYLPDVIGSVNYNFMYWPAYVDVSEFNITNSGPRIYKLAYFGEDKELKLLLETFCSNNSFKVLPEENTIPTISSTILNEIEYIIFDSFSDLRLKDKISIHSIACGCKIIDFKETKTDFGPARLKVNSLEECQNILSTPFSLLSDLDYRRIVYSFDIDLGLDQAIERLRRILN